MRFIEPSLPITLANEEAGAEQAIDASVDDGGKRKVRGLSKGPGPSCSCR
jgi:hypothetical protein